MKSMSHTGWGRRGILAAMAASLAPTGLRAAAPSGYPDRPVRLTVSYGAGGAVDTLARIMMPKLAQRLGQTVIIDNRPGAGGTIGAASIARAPADGYNLLDDGSGFIINSILMQIPYDIHKDFEPIARVATIPNVLLLGPSIQAKTVAEVVAQAKADPGGLDCSSTGVGSSQHLALEIFNKMAGTRIAHVPYKDAPASQNDLRSGRIAMTFATATTAIPLHGQNGMRVIAHGGTEPIEMLPGIPPISDTVQGYSSQEWQGIFAPAGTPGPILDRLSESLSAVLSDPAIVERFTQLGARSRPETRQEFTTFIREEARRMAAQIKEAGIAL